MTNIKRRAPDWRAAFLRVLGRTGNVALAAREAGANRSRLYALRRRDPELAGAWDKALSAARLRLAASGAFVPASERAPLDRRDRLGTGCARDERGLLDFARSERRTKVRGSSRKGSDEFVRWRSKVGPQLSRARPGMLTASSAGRFLEALRECCNVTVACERAKVRRGTVYRQRRGCADFAAAWDDVLADAYARLEMALVGAAAAVVEDRAPEGAEFGGMSAATALGLLTHYRRKMEGRRAARGAGAEPSVEELRAEVLRRLAAMRASFDTPPR